MTTIDCNRTRIRFVGWTDFRFATCVLAITQIVLLCPWSFAFAQPPQDIRPLVAGTVMEREIQGSEKHSYSLTVAQGEFVHVSVKQRGVDLAVKLFGPDGQLIDGSSQRDWGDKEHVYVVTQSAGAVTVEVTPPQKDSNKVAYTIAVEKWRVATQPDRDRFAARQLHREGLVLEQKAETRRQAIEKLREALRLYVRAEQPLGAVDMLHDIATINARLGETDEALDSLNQALPLCREAGSLRCETVTYNYIGTVYQDYAGDHRKALEAMFRALESVRAEHNARREAIALNNVAITYVFLGDYQNASEYYHQSLALRRQSGDRRGEATTLNNIGGSYRDLGEFQKSLEYYDLSLAIARELKDHAHEARMHNNKGSVYSDTGDYPKALEYFNLALAVRRELRDRRGEATTLNNIGGVHQKLGDHRKALEYYEQSLALTRLGRERPAELRTLIAMGRTYGELDEYSKALEFLNQALPMSRAMGKRSDEASTLHAMAEVESKRGNLSAAQTQIEAAIEIIESIRGTVASSDLRASFLASKQHYYQFYIDLLTQLPQRQAGPDPIGTALTINERARARSLMELLIESRTDIRQGVDQSLLESERAIQTQLNIKSARYSQLSDNQNNAQQAAALKAEIDSLIDKYRRVEAQIRVQSPRYAALTQPQSLSLKEIQKQVLDPQSLLLEYRLGKERSYLWVVSDTTSHGFVLPKGDDIQAAATRLYGLVSGAAAIETIKTSVKVSAHATKAALEYQQAASELSQMLLGPVADQLGRKRLLIVADGALEYIPFAALPTPEGKGKRSEADGQAGARRRGARSTMAERPPLIANHEIVNLPSASVLALLRRELGDRKPAPKALAVLADPVFANDDTRVAANHTTDKPAALAAASGPSQTSAATLQRSQRESGFKGFVRLRFSRQEAEAISALLPENDSLKALDFTASRATAVSEGLGQYRILHFATHGLLNSQHPELSGLVFSLVDERGKAQDGFLRFHDIYNLKLNADLVVLSACQTALGKEIRGEGLIGLTRGFMYAGAPRVVASLWRVDDRATAELMKRFYQGMLKGGLRPAAALRAAQVSMLKEKRWAAPQYWAAFTLQGEWR